MGYPGHLVSILTQEEQLFLKTDLGTRPGSILPGDMWIGLADEDFDGVWNWVTGEPVWDLNDPSPSCLAAYCNWGSGEPNNDGGD